MNGLRAFAMVAEMGSLTEAAEKLGRTPSTVSVALKALEAEVGVPLFESERKNRLSKAGQVVLAETQDLLSHYERATAAIRAFARNQAGRIDIACVPSIAISLLPVMLPAFRANLPGVEVNVRDADSPSVAEAVETGRASLGVASLRRSRPELHFEPLFCEKLGIVCRSDDPLTTATRPIAWRDIGERTFIGNSVSRSIETPELAALFSDAPIVVHNVLSLLALVRTNIGITVLPRLSMVAWPDGLAFLPLEDQSARRTVGFVTRSIERNTPTVDAFTKEFRRLLIERAPQLGIDIVA